MGSPIERSEIDQFLFMVDKVKVGVNSMRYFQLFNDVPSISVDYICQRRGKICGREILVIFFGVKGKKNTFIMAISI